MLHMGFIFVRDRGFSECSPWPVQGWDMMLSGKDLLARVRALDQESMTELSLQHREPGLRVGIVTICAYAEDEAVRQFNDENKRMYSQLHDYALYFYTDASQIAPNVKDGVHKAFFWKVNAVQNVLDTGLYDWVIWMD